MKAEIWRIWAEYEKKMEAVAQRFNHSLLTAYKIAGDVTIASRDLNLFNIFQKWFIAEDGNNDKVPGSANPGQYLTQQWRLLRKEKLGDHWNDTAKIEEEFCVLRDWYSSRYSNEQRMAQGPTKQDVRSVAKIVSDVAKQAMLNRGIWVYAFIIDPKGRYSMISGWGKEYESMKMEYPSQITSQLHDVGILLGGEHIKAQISSNIPKDLKLLVVATSQVGNNRERKQALIPKILLYDIGHLNIPCLARFPWKNYADYVYKHQICIINWLEDVAAPGAGLKDVNQAVQKHGGPSPLTAVRIEELIWLKDTWARKEENPTPPQQITSKALRVVSWTEEEKNLPTKQQKDVALVKCVDGRTLTSVLHSKDWCKEQGSQMNNLKQKSKSRQKSPSPSSSESEHSPPPPPDLEEGRPPFTWSDEEEEPSGLQRHPEPSPFLSLMHRKQLSPIPPRLFIGYKSQQQYLQSSDAEMSYEEVDNNQTRQPRPLHSSQRPGSSRLWNGPRPKRPREDSNGQSAQNCVKKVKGAERRKLDFGKLLKCRRKVREGYSVMAFCLYPGLS
ncbi:hypothetical protein VKT23_012783 [Stygiomarasmius scandens]|uniref:Transposase n=1 Tax=Marasmiellus scandens TaxID=2682957 RepID=A0ABR1J5W6_9AGAR